MTPTVRPATLAVVRVVSSLAATIFVNGIPEDDWGVWDAKPSGTHTVSFGAVPGYMTWAPLSASVFGGSLTTIKGTYMPAVPVCSLVLTVWAFVGSTSLSSPHIGFQASARNGATLPVTPALSEFRSRNRRPALLEVTPLARSG